MKSVAQWQLLNSGFHSGAHNMNVDELLATRLLDGEGSPTLRLYGWKPFAISLGYNQREDDLNETKCAMRGIDIVRRPTGGRAILHAEELTYSVVMFAKGKSISDIYCEISKALVSGLRLLGANVEYAPAQPNFSELYRSQNSIPCFSSSARYEIQHGGRKLVGSAQRRYQSLNSAEVVLQHGSVLLGAAHKELSEFLNDENEEAQAAIRRDLDAKTVDLSTVVGREVSFDEVATAVKTGFEREWKIVFSDSDLDESSLASDLQRSHNFSSNEKVIQ